MRLNNPTRFSDPFGYVSSGSEHDAVFHDDDVDDSPNLSDLVECFVEQRDYSCSKSNNCNKAVVFEAATDSASDRADPYCSISTSIRVVSDLLNNSDSSLSYKRTLESHVSEAVKTLERFGSRDKPTTNRNVMYFLRKLGHNAAICKTKWDASGSGLSAGTYEFIDVVIDTGTRYFIDLNFATEFEIARPTEHYSNLHTSLPTVVVATEDSLKKVIKVMADEARRSLKSKDLHLPPWRKNRYVQMKWFGSYKRTTNLFPTTNSPLASVNYAANCTRFVGFEALLSSRRLVARLVATSSTSRSTSCDKSTRHYFFYFFIKYYKVFIISWSTN